MYELSAVLIHRGISAYSGHYIAHVKDACTGDWYKFNDEEIEKMEGKKLQLGIEEDIGELPGRRKKKQNIAWKRLVSHDMIALDMIESGLSIFVVVENH